MIYVELILVGLSLSIDAFSLAMGISISNKIKSILKYSICVGIFHFFMPILGYLLKRLIDNIYIIPPDIIFIIVICFIIIGIIIDDKKNQIINPYLFSFTVSIDSFSFGLSLNRNSLFKSGIIFSIISFLFTLSGFKFGKYINNRYQNYSKLLSIIILILVVILKLL